MTSNFSVPFVYRERTALWVNSAFFAIANKSFDFMIHNANAFARLQDIQEGIIKTCHNLIHAEFNGDVPFPSFWVVVLLFGIVPTQTTMLGRRANARRVTFHVGESGRDASVGTTNR